MAIKLYTKSAAIGVIGDNCSTSKHASSLGKARFKNFSSLWHKKHERKLVEYLAIGILWFPLLKGFVVSINWACVLIGAGTAYLTLGWVRRAPTIKGVLLRYLAQLVLVVLMCVIYSWLVELLKG
jgi:hypothetical protein